MNNQTVEREVTQFQLPVVGEDASEPADEINMLATRSRKRQASAR